MKKSKFAGTVFFALFTGLITGSIITYMIMKPGPEKFDFEKRHARIIIQAAKQLELNQDQEKQFYAIYSKYLKRGCALVHPLRSQLVKILEEKDKEISSILTPEQQKIFRKVSSEKMKRFKEKFANPETVIKYFPKSE
jgi:Spy/CpxP family protein refolding chaperone